MQRSKIFWMVASLIFAIGVGYTIGTHHDKEALNTTVVRSYVLPFERADELKGESVMTGVEQMAGAIQEINWLLGSKNTEDQLIEDENLKQMRTALDRLPTPLREVLLLSEFSDMPYSKLFFGARSPQ